MCRCEELTRATIDEAVATTADVNVVKILTRAGMGLCQGRNCQRQIAAMIGRQHALAALRAAHLDPAGAGATGADRDGGRRLDRRHGIVHPR